MKWPRSRAEIEQIQRERKQDALERALARLLRGPVLVSFPAGDVMVLTGSGVTLRLRRT